MLLLSIDYHYVDDEAKYPLGGIYPVSQKKFKLQLEKLSEVFSFISQTDLLDVIYNKKVLPEKSCLITFDDGLRCQYDNALPILEELNIPAIFFVPGMVYAENKICIVHKIQKLRSTIEEIDFYNLINKKLLDIFDKSIGDYIDQFDSLKIERYRYDNQETIKLKYLLNSILTDKEKDLIIEPLFNQYFGDNKAFIQEFYMSENQLIDLQNRNYLGIHSYSHKSLTSINEENLKKDLLDCKNVIENITKEKIYSISYPYGSNQDFNQEVFDVCKNIGLKLGFTFIREFNSDLNNPFSIHRMDTNDVPMGKKPLFEIQNKDIYMIESV